jgi:hypothetical protein
VQDIQALGIGGHQPILDPIVDAAGAGSDLLVVGVPA